MPCHALVARLLLASLLGCLSALLALHIGLCQGGLARHGARFCSPQMGRGKGELQPTPSCTHPAHIWEEQQHCSHKSHHHHQHVNGTLWGTWQHFNEWKTLTGKRSGGGGWGNRIGSCVNQIWCIVMSPEGAGKHVNGCQWHPLVVSGPLMLGDTHWLSVTPIDGQWQHNQWQLNHNVMPVSGSKASNLLESMNLQMHTCLSTLMNFLVHTCLSTLVGMYEPAGAKPNCLPTGY